MINVQKEIPIWQVLLKQDKKEEERETITAITGKQFSLEEWVFQTDYKDRNGNERESEQETNP